MKKIIKLCVALALMFVMCVAEPVASLSVWAAGNYEPAGFGFSGKVFLIGDSTVSYYSEAQSKELGDRYGWGMKLADYFTGVTVENLAIGGTSSRTFLQQGNYTKLENELGSGDYLFIQFGHNDEYLSSAYRCTYPLLDPETLDEEGKNAEGQYSYEFFLKKYIALAKEKGAVPVLVTPVTFLAKNGGAVYIDHKNYRQAMIDLGQAENVAVMDMTMKTAEVYDDLYNNGKADETFKFHCYTDATKQTVDRVHLSSDGADLVASLIAQETEELGLTLGDHRKDASKPPETPEEEVKKITALSFEKEKYEVRLEKTIDLVLNVLPEGADTEDISWSSSDPKTAVVAVSEDKTVAVVTGLKEGTVTITAKTKDGVTASCTVTIPETDPCTITGIAFEQSSLWVFAGHHGELSIKVTGIYGKLNSDDLIWESSNDKIATVVPRNDITSAIVRGVKAGNAKITVTAKNGVTASVDITVGADAPIFPLPCYNEDDGKVYIAGFVQEDYTGLAKSGVSNDAPWIYIEHDKSSDRTGFVDYEGARFYVTEGRLDTSVNGVQPDADADPLVWYFCANGQVQTDHIGLAEYDDEWFYIENGKVATGMNAFVEYDGGLFAVGAGRIIREYSGLMQDPENTNTGDWYFFANGQAQTQYTGLVLYDGEWFYVRDGKLDQAYSGDVEYDGVMFNVVNGMVVR